MLIRSITKHVNDQNWFAVLIDFFIVVFGVFIGIQVSNWNSAKLSKLSEKAVLYQLHEEVLKAETELSSTRVNIPNIDEKIEDFVNVFFSDQGDVQDQDICYFSSGMGGLPNVVSTLSAVDELIATGRLSQLNDPVLRNLITEYHEKRKIGEALLPGLKEEVVALDRTFSNYFEVKAFVDETGEVRINSTCDASAIRADQEFRNALARNLDIYDAWRRRFIVQPEMELANLHTNIDRFLKIEHEETSP